jgi:hypothetical protein
LEQDLPDVPNILVTGTSEVLKTPDVFEVNLNTPLFGTTNPSTLIEAPTARDDIFDDSDTVQTLDVNTLFPDLFAKGSECAICYRTGWVPLWHPVGRQRYVYATHNIRASSGYNINQGVNPSVLQSEVTDDTGYVEYLIDVPKYYKAVYVGIYNNTALLSSELKDTAGNVINAQRMSDSAGTRLVVRISDMDFTHVVVEFDLGVVIQANFPQFSIARDYSQFFSLQSVSIELPATVSNAQIGDVVVVPTWDRAWQITDVGRFVDGTTLIKTTTQARVINTIETLHTLVTPVKLI